MVDDTKIRHFRPRTRAGITKFYWEPSKTVSDLGMTSEALGENKAKAEARAKELNQQADKLRAAASLGCNGPKPGSCTLLFREFRASDEWAELKPRTRKDYAYYLDKIEAEFGSIMVRALSPKVLKVYYRRVRKETGITWAYHIMATFRTVLSWAESEDWRADNPAKKVRVKQPKKRDVVWKYEETETYLAKAAELGWHSIVAMVHVFDSIGQSPVDVRTLLRGSYNGARIDTSRQKTGKKGAPIMLFPTAVQALDSYLSTETAKLPSAPLFTCEKTGGAWHESTLQHTHAVIRAAAGLRKVLQLQDFRTTVQTEGGAGGGTVDELKGLARHSSRAAGEHYVYPDERYVDAIQQKRLTLRAARKNTVGTA